MLRHLSFVDCLNICTNINKRDSSKQTQRIMYLTDLTDAQKEYINRCSEGVYKGTILMDNWWSKYDFFLILDAIIYIDVSGCQWRMLPTEYPKCQIVYYYFRRWGAMDTFSELEEGLVEKVRLKR